MAHNIDEDLNQVERDIRTLKIEYEQFFGGGRPRPPADTQWRVETLMRRFNERDGELSSGQRFRFNNLAQTYAKYVEMWRKKTMQKEGWLHRSATSEQRRRQSRPNAHAKRSEPARRQSRRRRSCRVRARAARARRTGRRLPSRCHFPIRIANMKRL